MLEKSIVQNFDRNEIIFKTATELEVLGLSLSSTAEGYRNRIAVIRADIRRLPDLSRGGPHSDDFDDVRDILECLRRHCMTKGKAKVK